MASSQKLGRILSQSLGPRHRRRHLALDVLQDNQVRRFEVQSINRLDHLKPSRCSKNVPLQGGLAVVGLRPTGRVTRRCRCNARSADYACASLDARR